MTEEAIGFSETEVTSITGRFHSAVHAHKKIHRRKRKLAVCNVEFTMFRHIKSAHCAWVRDVLVNERGC